jgi:endonuclease G
MQRNNIRLHQQLTRFCGVLILVMIALIALSGCSSQSHTTTQPLADSGVLPSAVGLPVSTHRALKILVNDGFEIGYDQRDQYPAWVAFKVRPVWRYQRMPRPSFEADPRLARGSAHRHDYDGHAYDRGHMAPNYAIGQLYGDTAQRETFYFSNVVPQRPRLNQLLWQRLEEIEIDDIAPRVHTLWVMTGPIMNPPARLPVAFYRVWLAHAPDGGWQTLAFRVPQDVRGDERLDRYIVSIDSIEQATGLNFLAALPAKQQAALERQAAPANTFGFATWACAPARYGKRWQHKDGIRLHYDRCGRALQ